MRGINQDAAIRVTRNLWDDLRPRRWSACGPLSGETGFPALGYFSDDGYGVVTSDDAVFVAGSGLLACLVPSTDLLTLMDNVNRHQVSGYAHLAPDIDGTWSLMFGTKLTLDYFDEDGFRFALGSGCTGMGA